MHCCTLLDVPVAGLFGRKRLKFLSMLNIRTLSQELLARDPALSACPQQDDVDSLLSVSSWAAKTLFQIFVEGNVPFSVDEQKFFFSSTSSTTWRIS